MNLVLNLASIIDEIDIRLGDVFEVCEISDHTVRLSLEYRRDKDTNEAPALGVSVTDGFTVGDRMA